MPTRDNIQGNDSFLLQPGETRNVRVKIRVETADGANDGWIPYGTLPASCVPELYAEATGVDITSEVVTAYSISTNYIYMTIQYPAVTGDGIHRFRFPIVLDDGTTAIVKAHRLWAQTNQE